MSGGAFPFAKSDDGWRMPSARCASSKPREGREQQAQEWVWAPPSMSCRGPLCSRSYSDVSS